MSALAELQAEDEDPNFLRDLRFARGWTLAPRRDDRQRRCSCRWRNAASICGRRRRSAIRSRTRRPTTVHQDAARAERREVCRSTPRTTGRAARAQGLRAPRGLRRLVQKKTLRHPRPAEGGRRGRRERLPAAVGGRRRGVGPRLTRSTRRRLPARGRPQVASPSEWSPGLSSAARGGVGR